MRPALVLLLLAWSPAARAQGDQGAAANLLFEDAMRLMRAKKYPAACAKFEDSIRLAEKYGTMFNLADCHQRIGRTASAYDEFGRAAKLADGRPERQRKALERQRALKSRLSWILVKVPAAARVPGLEITRNGVPVVPSLYDTPFPVDQGTHDLTATAPDHREWKGQVAIAGEGTTSTIEVPLLTPLVKPPVTASPPPPPPAPVPVDRGDPGQTQRIIGWLAGGVGVALLGASGFFAWQARSKWKDAEPLCPERQCTLDGYDLARDARAMGNRATFAFGFGAAAVGAGVVLIFTAPERPRVSPRVGTRSVAFVVEGVF